jgi:hypothetical protein
LNYGKFDSDALNDVYMIARDIEVKGEMRQKEIHLLRLDTLHDDDFKDWHYIDDTTGEVLDPKMVCEGRKEEMRIFKEMGVYVHVLREVAMKDEEGKLVGVRWVDVLKNEVVRSRLVAQEFKEGDRDDLFAGTPPLSALKFLLSSLCSNGVHGTGGLKFMVLDIKRAFLYGDIEENIYINLPTEDPKGALGYVGKLVKAMYGTHSAPLIWQKLCRSILERLGFTSSITSPCCYYILDHGLKVVTHVDDFACTGLPKDLHWLKEELEK